MQINLDIPEDLENTLTQKWGNLSQKVLESLVIEAYQAELIPKAKIQEILNLSSRWQVEALLKRYRVYLDYSEADLEQDLQAINNALKQ